MLYVFLHVNARTMTCIHFEFNKSILPTEITSLIKIAHNWYGFWYVYIQLKTDDNMKITAFIVRMSDLVKTSLFHVCNWLQWKCSTMNLRADITCGSKVTEVRDKIIFLCGRHRESFCDRSIS
jgi:hypothetical protein